VALRAREIDMRASPYDLTAYRQPNGQRGLGGDFKEAPILIETTEVHSFYYRDHLPWKYQGSK
jgi:hypothetical protein